MRRVLLLVWLAGCARAVPTSSAVPPTAPSDAPRPTPLFTSPDIPTLYKDAAVASTMRFKKSPALMAAAVRLAYANIGVPVTVDEPGGKRIGNADFYRSRNFAGKAMTELVSCGSSMTGPNASSFRIYMKLLTSIEADGQGGSIVGVLFESTARDVVGGASNDRMSCGTTGVLEQLLFAKFTSYLGA
ncbi:MAG: hypothetical protein IPP90_15430 [Gemmatimonadaceae bacterium]|nr:hypothetical protein [Gemmatimonadaceae bacterium]